MKKIIAIASLIVLASCGKPIEVDNKHYPTYGLFNEDTRRSKDMCYEISVGNVIWSIILVETIIAPVYFVGWSLWNPVGKKDANGKCGIDAQ